MDQLDFPQTAETSNTDAPFREPETKELHSKSFLLLFNEELEFLNKEQRFFYSDRQNVTHFFPESLFTNIQVASIPWSKDQNYFIFL